MRQQPARRPQQQRQRGLILPAPACGPAAARGTALPARPNRATRRRLLLLGLLLLPLLPLLLLHSMLRTPPVRVPILTRA
jgi:hypothetical protein